MSLYRIYRPRTIQELDLTAVREKLMGMVQGSQLAHAYLFTGPRGAGKTSAARILARVVNCEHNVKKLGEPCNECSACQAILDGAAVDVIEIDAASNRGIDDIRELKEKIKLSPAGLRKKVYIIDEVHMLTTEAFNALLKTLEEPPSHALFILCTTERHKVPETIVSRCMEVNFYKATPEEMKRSFGRVIKGEKAQIEDEALEILAKGVDGSFRDGVKLLETSLAASEKVTVEMIEKLLYGASGFAAPKLAKALTERNLDEAVTLFGQARKAGVELTHILVSLMKALRASTLAGLGVKGVESSFKSGPETVELIYLLDETARKASSSPAPDVLAEAALIQWCSASQTESPTPKSPPKPSTPPKSQPNRKKEDQPTTAKSEPPKTEVMAGAGITANTAIEEGSWDQTEAQELWRKLSASLNGGSYSLGALLSKARPGQIRGDLVTIEMSYDFHRDQLMQNKFRTQVEALVSEVVGRPMRIACVVRPEKLHDPGEIATIAATAPEENELLEAAEEIFNN